MRINNESKKSRVNRIGRSNENDKGRESKGEIPKRFDDFVYRKDKDTEHIDEDLDIVEISDEARQAVLDSYEESLDGDKFSER